MQCSGWVLSHSAGVANHRAAELQSFRKVHACVGTHTFLHAGLFLPCPQPSGPFSVMETAEL